MFFGSTTERVLRETTVPVLIVPGYKRGPDSLPDALAAVRRILVPVLLPADTTQLAVVRGLSDVLSAPVLLLHVVEPVRAVLPRGDRYLPAVERERRARAEADLDHLMEAFESRRAEALLAYGEPAEEIVKVADDRDAGLIVMSLTGSALAGPRIGSVTYRVLCAAGRLVLALPPGSPAEAGSAKAGNFSQTAKKAAATGSRVKAHK
jgi:nucleotide-binding universal stress UspA family protein